MKPAMIVVLELFLLGILGFLIWECVFRSTSADPGDGSIYSWIPILGATVVSMIFELIGGVMVKKFSFGREWKPPASPAGSKKDDCLRSR